MTHDIDWCLCRRHPDEFDDDSPRKPPQQNVVYRDDTAGRPKGQTVEVV